MIPVSPVLPSGRWAFIPPTETVIAKDQSEYLPLPAIIHRSHAMVTTRWKLSWGERFRCLLCGDVYLQQMTFGMRVQPVKLQTEEPSVDEVW